MVIIEVGIDFKGKRTFMLMLYYTVSEYCYDLKTS